MSEGECNDRNHAGLERVMMNAMERTRSLPDAALGQDVAAVAFAYERWLDERRASPTPAEIEAALRAVPWICKGLADGRLDCTCSEHGENVCGWALVPDYPALASAVYTLRAR